MKLLTLLLLPLVSTSQIEENPCSPLDQLAEECVPPTAREERDLFTQINSESRRLYNALDCEGKRRTLELMADYPNKNQAVQDAAKEMAKRRAALYHNRKTYPQRTREEGGQEYYDDRYGY